MGQREPEPAFLTPTELQRRLKISRRSYQRLLAQGVPHQWVLSARRFVWAEVVAWLPRAQGRPGEAHTPAPGPPARRPSRRLALVGPAAGLLTQEFKAQARNWGKG